MNLEGRRVQGKVSFWSRGFQVSIKRDWPWTWRSQIEEVENEIVALLL